MRWRRWLQLERLRRAGGQDQRGEHIVRSLEREGTIYSELLQSAGVGGSIFEPASMVSNFMEPPVGVQHVRGCNGPPLTPSSEQSWFDSRSN